MEAFRYLETVLPRNRVIFSFFVSLQVWLKEYETFQPLRMRDGVNLFFLALMCVFPCVFPARSLTPHVGLPDPT